MLMRADILLLDEPTNHLDVANVAWLENYLVNRPEISSVRRGTLLSSLAFIPASSFWFLSRLLLEQGSGPAQGGALLP